MLGLNDGFVLTRVDLSLMSNLAPVDRILQQGVERAAGKSITTRQDAAGALSALTHDPKSGKFLREKPD